MIWLFSGQSLVWLIIISYLLPILGQVYLFLELRNSRSSQVVQQQNARELNDQCEKLVNLTRNYSNDLRLLGKELINRDEARRVELEKVTSVILSDWERTLQGHSVQIADRMVNRLVSRQIELIPGYHLWDLMTVDDKLKWLEAVDQNRVLEFTTNVLVPKYAKEVNKDGKGGSKSAPPGKGTSNRKAGANAHDQ
jgi:hypothetical protein